MKKTFSDFFPLPNFLETCPAGLSISERSIHVVEFVKRHSKLILGKYGFREIPAGAIKEGYINDKQVVTEALRSLQKELSLEFVNVSLPDEKAYLFTTEIPRSAEGDIRQAVELQLEENVPISAGDAIFDFTVIPPRDRLDHINVSVSVLPSKVVLTYSEIINASGFRPLSLSIEADALSRSVVPTGNMGTFMIVNVGESCTGISVVSRGVVQFSLTVPLGGEAITEAIAQHFSVSIGEALKIKKERGFVKNRENLELFSSLMNGISVIKDEINRSLVYWRTHRNLSNTGDGDVEKIILCGKDVEIVGFNEYLSLTMKIPVEAVSVWENAFSLDDYVPRINRIDSLDYAAAVGLALPTNNL